MEPATQKYAGGHGEHSDASPSPSLSPKVPAGQSMGVLAPRSQYEPRGQLGSGSADAGRGHVLPVGHGPAQMPLDWLEMSSLPYSPALHASGHDTCVAGELERVEACGHA